MGLVWMQDLLYVRDIVPVDSLVHLGKFVIAADPIDELLDMIVLELDIIEDCPVGAQGSKDAISAERNHAMAVDRQGVHQGEDVGLDAIVRLLKAFAGPFREITTNWASPPSLPTIKTSAGVSVALRSC